MSASKSKSTETALAQPSRLQIAKRAMRKAQRNAIKEDLRYGLKPALAEPAQKRKSRAARRQDP